MEAHKDAGASKVNKDKDGKSEHDIDVMDVDNSKTVISKIANLYAERLMSDVCLVVGNVSWLYDITREGVWVILYTCIYLPYI